jgi:hypothetical protein
MWIVAVFLWALLCSGTAAAFDCVNATLPSSLVICADPELIGLADERQEAINEARGRIGEDRWAALWEDQKAWVRSYATACGVPPAPAALPGLSFDQGVLQPGRCRADCLPPGIWHYCRKCSDLALPSGSKPGSHRAEL